MSEARQQALLLTAEENYAHARDHEHLRAQITSILVGASFVLLGLAVSGQIKPHAILFSSAISILIGILNVWLVILHNNRFDRHVDIARKAKHLLTGDESLNLDSKIHKRGSISTTWTLVASLPILGGLCLGLLLLNDFL